jgi:lipopolysaccharide export system permease protein
MNKIINRYIIKELTIPFASSLFILIFVLLSNFILKNMDKFLGKGLSLGTVLKFLVYNSAWIISLAIPMSILIATLMAFGRLSSDNEITAFKASGISMNKLILPAMIFGLIVFSLITPFNLWILPEMNHNVRKISHEISRNRPDIEFNEQLLNSFSDKIIYVGKRLSTHSFDNVVIFDKAQKDHTTIMAEKGTFKSFQDGIVINLQNGSIHEELANDEYRKTYFNIYKIAIPFDQLEFNLSNNLIRQERELNINALSKKIKSYKNNIKNTEIKITLNDNKIDSLDKLLSIYKNKNNLLMINMIENQRDNQIFRKDKNFKLIKNYKQQINKYSVEVHKKFSIPIACFIFILLGTPLGIMAKNSNMSVSIAISILFFIVYWSFLIAGEDFADRGRFNPALSMWAPNIFLGMIAFYLYLLISKENINFSFNFKFLKLFKSK